MFRPRQPEKDASFARVVSDGPVNMLFDQAALETPSHMARRAASTTTYFPGLARLDLLGVDDFLNWILRFKWLIAAIAALCITIALAYALTASPRFTVYTDIVVDPSNLNIVTDDALASSLRQDSQILNIETRLRVLTSRNVLSQVVEKLNLSEDPEFVKTGFVSRLKEMFGMAEPSGDRQIGALRALAERVDARREERSFVVTLAVWSETPEKAVMLSEALTEAFEEELFRSAAQSAGRVADSLNRSLGELRQNATDAERRVEDFRRANGLQAGATGELMSNQLSSTLNTQVLEAQQRFIQAQTRYDQMKAAINQGPASSSAILDSESMTSLRAQYDAIQQEIGALAQIYGPKYSRLLDARSSEAALRTAMNDEAQRILELARATLANEKEALEALRIRASDKQASVFTENAAEIELRDLQRDARSKAALYETYLARTQQIAEREQLDTTNIHVISEPLPPSGRSWPPRTAMLVIAGAIGGLAMGLGAAFVLGFWQFLRSAPPARRSGPVVA